MTVPEAVTIVERPPVGPARGALGAPIWLVVLIAAGLLLLSCLVLVRAWRRRTK